MGKNELNGRTRKIVLIACAKRKLNHPAPAAQLYTSPLFKKSLDYARTLNPDAIHVLSAKHGLVDIDEVIAPYELTLNKLPTRDVKAWSQEVLSQIARVADPEQDHFTILAGRRYYQYLLPALRHVDLPLEGMALGKRLQWLSDTNTRPDDSVCADLHELVSCQPRFTFPFDAQKLPSDGIYILFEQGERAHGTDRIVRIGTHRGNAQLAGRLLEHFLNENKDRSIFRKNIGRALLNRDGDDRINQWEADLTSRSSRESDANRIDSDFINSVEKRVSDIIQSGFSFTTIPVNKKDDRMRLEAGLIATIAACPVCKPSNDWLGLHSPKHRICESGLWLVQGLKAPLLTSEEVARLFKLLPGTPR